MWQNEMNLIPKMSLKEYWRTLQEGGQGSGHFDHAGRPGEVGGSAPGGGGAHAIGSHDHAGRPGKVSGSGPGGGTVVSVDHGVNYYRTNPDALVAEIADRMDDNSHDVIGLRGMYKDEIGKDKLPVSNEWVDGRRTSRRLPGTSAIEISGIWSDDPQGLIDKNIMKGLPKVLKYGDSDYIGIIAGDKTSIEGNDPSEVIIGNARVIAYIRK